MGHEAHEGETPVIDYLQYLNYTEIDKQPKNMNKKIVIVELNMGYFFYKMN